MTVNSPRTLEQCLMGGDLNLLKRLPPIIMAILFVPGCRLGTSPYPETLQSPDLRQKINAAIRAGETKDAWAVPQLVDCLNHQDPAVRFYSILALERITGTRLGFDYRKPADERSAAVARWRDFLRQRGERQSPASDGS